MKPRTMTEEQENDIRDNPVSPTGHIVLAVLAELDAEREVSAALAKALDDVSGFVPERNWTMDARPAIRLYQEADERVLRVRGAMRKQTPVTETPQQKAYREIVEQIANNISALAVAVEGLLKGPLKRKALVILLASSSRQSQATVDAVLQALQDLKGDWLNK